MRGYILASLGRHVLHGDSSTVGDRPMTSWGLRTFDFIALQNAYLQLYIDSFGQMYNQQLQSYLPFAFHPDFTVHAKQRWSHLTRMLEPVYTSVRNWMYTESFNLIDFGPYFPLVAFPEVRQTLLREAAIQDGRVRRRVLIDVGANGFFASPKYLLDSYAPFLPFTHAIMVEPEPHFSASVPRVYSERYNISHQQIYAEVATGSDTDMLKLLPTLVTKDDFVVLKFDVDPNRYTPRSLFCLLQLYFTWSIRLCVAIDLLKDQQWSGVSSLRSCKTQRSRNWWTKSISNCTTISRCCTGSIITVIGKLLIPSDTFANMGQWYIPGHKF